MTKRLLPILFLATPALADTFIEGFENGSNVGGWTLGGPNAHIEPEGGNPGAWLYSPGLDTFGIYTWMTEPADVYLGDYRARGVTSVGLDAILLKVDFSAAERPMTVVLVHDNDTPGYFEDDCYVYFTGPEIPQPGQGWKSYDFAIPAQSETLPDGWAVICNFEAPDKTPDEVWNETITGVDSLEFWWFHPEFFYIFQMWEPGIDNVRITFGAGGCYPDFDKSGELNLFDFLAYTNAFNAGDDAADCDASGALNLFDFLCFTNAFNEGC